MPIFVGFSLSLPLFTLGLSPLADGELESGSSQKRNVRLKAHHNHALISPPYSTNHNYSLLLAFYTNQNTDFCVLNNKKFTIHTYIRYQFSTSSRYVHLPMKLNGKLPNGSYVNRWFVGFRKNDEEQIEIWAVDAREGTQWSGVPICRVYPSPSSLYR